MAARSKSLTPAWKSAVASDPLAYNAMARSRARRALSRPATVERAATGRSIGQSCPHQPARAARCRRMSGPRPRIPSTNGVSYASDQLSQQSAERLLADDRDAVLTSLLGLSRHRVD